MRLSAALGPLVAVCAAACAFALPAKLPAAPDYKHLYETHQWFALRDAVNSAAGRALKMDVRGDPPPSRASESRELLIAIYYRQGKYKSALAADDPYHHQP